MGGSSFTGRRLPGEEEGSGTSHEAWCAFACCRWEGKKEEEFIGAQPEMTFCCFWFFSELWRGDVSVPDTRRALECTQGAVCHFRRHTKKPLPLSNGSCCFTVAFLGSVKPLLRALQPVLEDTKGPSRRKGMESLTKAEVSTLISHFPKKFL